jgi:hypothetical protein
LVADRWDLTAPAVDLRIPSLWFFLNGSPDSLKSDGKAQLAQRATSRKVIVWLQPGPNEKKDSATALSRWLDDLPTKP